MHFIYWILVSFGITTIVAISKIFEPLRRFIARKNTFLGNLLPCTMCLGFWTGIFLSLTYFSPTGNIFFDACLSSACCWLLYCFTWFTTLRFGV
jgi:hypothetical protein